MASAVLEINTNNSAESSAPAKRSPLTQVGPEKHPKVIEYLPHTFDFQVLL